MTPIKSFALGLLGALLVLAAYECYVGNHRAQQACHQVDLATRGQFKCDW